MNPLKVLMNIQIMEKGMLKYFIFALTAVALMCPDCKGQTLPTTEVNADAAVVDDVEEFQPDEEADESDVTDSDDMSDGD